MVGDFRDSYIFILGENCAKPYRGLPRIMFKCGKPRRHRVVSEPALEPSIKAILSRLAIGQLKPYP
jgi:hypothetical protein